MQPARSAAHGHGELVSPSLHAALDALRTRGAVTLPGRRSDVVLRSLRNRRVMAFIALGVAVVGLVAAVAGALLLDTVPWALLLPAGIFLAFFGLLVAGAVGLSNLLLSGRLRAEELPVVLDQRGITLRGIGPIPWSDVAPPERRRVWVRNDIGGDCTVMPLTPQGFARVRQQPAGWRTLVGPKPYLRFDIPYLLLPGIKGLTEDETMQLFGIARQQHVR